MISSDINPMVQAYRQIAIDVKSKLAEMVTSRLMAWQPDSKALVKYPFLGNMLKFAQDYSECFVIESDGNSLSLGVNHDIIKQKGLPKNIVNIIEYGDEVIPPFLHIRAMQKMLSDAINARIKIIL